MATCEKDGHLWGIAGTCIMCSAPRYPGTQPDAPTDAATALALRARRVARKVHDCIADENEGCDECEPFVTALIAFAQEHALASRAPSGERAAVLAEREACARLCEDVARRESERTHGRPTSGEYEIGARFCASAIRALSEASDADASEPESPPPTTRPTFPLKGAPRALPPRTPHISGADASEQHE